MTKLSLEGQKWELESGVCLDTREVFARLAAKKIEKSQLCWSEKEPERQPVSIRFPLIGPYGILKLIGEGTFGRVYIAFDARYKTSEKKGKLVALKAPTEALLMRYAEVGQGLDDEAEAKAWARLNIGELFSKEAVLTASLSTCSSVVSVLDHSTTHPYLVLEYCSGGSLTKRLRRFYDGEIIYRWGYQVSHALHEAHSLKPQCLVHRDLKPDNILLHEKNLKISDFGTSQLVSQTQSLKSLRSGYTPAYAAPEAWDGKAYPATDIWSLGVILYQITCSHLPFEGSSITQLCKKIIIEKPTSLIDRPGIGLKDEVYLLIEACLEKDPKNRPSAEDCREMFSRLSGLGVDPREKELKKEQEKIKAKEVALQAAQEKIELEKQRQAQEIATQAKAQEAEKKKQAQEFAEKQRYLKAQEAALQAQRKKMEVEQKADSRRLEKEYQEKFRQATEEHKISLDPNATKPRKNNTPWIILTVALALIIGFFLWKELDNRKTNKKRLAQMKEMESRFSEIKKQEEEKEKEEKEAENSRLEKLIVVMEREFNKIKRSNDKPEEKILRWNSFLKKHKEPIPLTTQDDDILKKAREEIEKEREKEKWIVHYQKMNGAYRSLINNHEVKKASIQDCQNFLGTYSQNNPYTKNDEKMRQKVQSILEELNKKPEPEPSDSPKGWPTSLWQECWKNSWVDFSSVAWEKLSNTEQTQYAKTYQAWYAQSKKTSTEKSFALGKSKIQMILVPPGQYWMGSPENEVDRGSDEKRHKVLIREPYWIGKYEVTQGQWEGVMGNNPANFKKGSKHPVEQVSWTDCQEFCKKTGFRLPSESEWEYACRGGTTSPFNLGGNISPDVVNYNGNYPYSGANKGIYRQTTVEVGSLGNENSWGGYNFHGNLYEWCQDIYTSDYSNTPTDGSVYIGEGSYLVLRGGSWVNYARNCRSAFRADNFDDRDDYVGLRLSRSFFP